MNLNQIHPIYKIPGSTEIWYYTHEFFDLSIFSLIFDDDDYFIDITGIDIQNLNKTHNFVGFLNDKNLEAIFDNMQAKIFDGEKVKQFILDHKLSHTYMFVGDIIKMDNKIYMCCGFGWNDLTKEK